MQSISNDRYQQLKRHFGNIGYETDFALHVARKQGTVATVASETTITITDANIQASDIILCGRQTDASGDTLVITKAACSSGSATITVTGTTTGGDTIQYVIYPTA
jgi:hypothetical protein